MADENDKPSRSLEDIAKDISEEKNPQKFSDLTDELSNALKKEDEKDKKKKRGNRT